MHLVRACLNRIFTYIHKKIWACLSLGKISFGKAGVIGSNTHFTINDNGKISVGKNIGIRRGCEFSASENGKISIGDNVFFNNACMVISHDNIIIGDNTKFGPGVMIFDHDYDFKNENNYRVGKHKSTPIIIGENCWIGAGTIILRGTKVGDNCVVGAGGILKGVYDDNNLVIQKKEEFLKEIINEG